MDVLFSSFILAATSLSSRAVVWLPVARRQTWLPWLQALAVGLLLGDAFIHVLPHALEEGHRAADTLTLAAIGVVALVCVESVVRRTMTDVPPGIPGARMTLVGDMVHHAVDGMILASAFAAGPAAGYTALIAIALHEVPREIGSAGALVAMGYAPGRAFVLSVLMASVVPVAAVAVQAVSLDAQLSAGISAFAAGTIAYVALADILPGVWERARGKAGLAPAVGATIGLVFMVVLAHGEH